MDKAHSQDIDAQIEATGRFPKILRHHDRGWSFTSDRQGHVSMSHRGIVQMSFDREHWDALVKAMA